MKLALAVPTYGPTEPDANRYLRVAIMQAAKDGLEWVGDLSTNRVGWDLSRNTIVKAALETDADALAWVDSDVILPAGAFSALAAQEKDFITGVYYQRVKPHFPLIAHFDPVKRHFNWFIDFPPDVVAPIDGCGFGCVLTSLRMLRAMARPWFAFEQYSEDFDFCLRAREAGFPLFVHTGVQCGHLADPQPMGQAEFEAVKRSPGGLKPYESRREGGSAA